MSPSTLLVLAWGVFAFGAVYPWAFMPLAAGCALLGLAGLATGRRSFPAEARTILTALAVIAVVGILQLIPLPQPQLASVSPGTDRFLRAYDLRYAFAVDRPDLDLGLPGDTLWHPISIAPDATLRALGLLAAFALLLFGLMRSLSRRGAMRLGLGIVALGAIVAMVGIVQKAILGDHAYGGMKIYGFWQPRNLLTTPFGPFVNKNHFAGWMLMVIPLAFAMTMQAIEESGTRIGKGLRERVLWLSSHEGSRALMLASAAFLMTLALVMTKSRSGLGCFLAVALAAGVVAGRRTSSRFGTIFFVSGLLAAIALALAWAGRDTALERFATESDSVQLRLNIWRVAAAIVRDFPLLGSGLDTFGSATMIYQPPSGDVHYQEAHNDYLQILTEGGIVTFAAGAAAAAGLARGTSRRLRDHAHGASRWLRTGAALGLFAVALQALVEFSLQMPGNAALFTVLAAVALHDSEHHGPRPRHS